MTLFFFSCFFLCEPFFFPFFSTRTRRLELSHLEVHEKRRCPDQFFFSPPVIVWNPLSPRIFFIIGTDLLRPHPPLVDWRSSKLPRRSFFPPPPSSPGWTNVPHLTTPLLPAVDPLRRRVVEALFSFFFRFFFFFNPGCSCPFYRRFPVNLALSTAVKSFPIFPFSSAQSFSPPLRRVFLIDRKVRPVRVFSVLLEKDSAPERSFRHPKTPRLNPPVVHPRRWRGHSGPPKGPPSGRDPVAFGNQLGFCELPPLPNSHRLPIILNSSQLCCRLTFFPPLSVPAPTRVFFPPGTPVTFPICSDAASTTSPCRNRFPPLRSFFFVISLSLCPAEQPLVRTRSPRHTNTSCLNRDSCRRWLLFFLAFFFFFQSKHCRTLSSRPKNELPCFLALSVDTPCRIFSTTFLFPSPISFYFPFPHSVGCCVFLVFPPPRSLPYLLLKY